MWIGPFLGHIKAKRITRFLKKTIRVRKMKVYSAQTIFSRALIFKKINSLALFLTEIEFKCYTPCTVEL